MSNFSLAVTQADDDRVCIYFRVSDLNNSFNTSYYSQIAISTKSVPDGSKSLSGILIKRWADDDCSDNYIEFKYDSAFLGSGLTEYDAEAFSLGRTYSVYAYAKSDDLCWYRIGGSGNGAQLFFVRAPVFECTYPDPDAEKYPNCVKIRISNYYMNLSSSSFNQVGCMLDGVNYTQTPPSATKTAANFHLEYTEDETVDIYATVRTKEDDKLWIIGHTTFYHPSSTKPAKWDWNSQNVNASAADTYAAYSAITNKLLTTRFKYSVWNDLVDKTKAVLEWKGNLNTQIGERLSNNYGENITASTTYGELLDNAYVYSADRTIYARKFNCVRYCIGSHLSTNIDLKIPYQSEVRGADFRILATKLNEIIN